MNSSGRGWRWACAALGLLCALLVAATVLRESGGSGQWTVDSEQGSGFRIQEKPVDSRQLTVDSQKLKVERRAEQRSQESGVRSQEKPVESRKLKVERPREVAPSSDQAIQNPKSQSANHAEPIPNPKSEITNSLKPLGYVEKAGGLVEAVVEEGGQIYIVHAGETFADKFKVLTISRDEVQVAKLGAGDWVLGTGDAGEGVSSSADGQDSGVRRQQAQVESRKLNVERRAPEGIQSVSRRTEVRSQNKAKVEIASGVLIRGGSESSARGCEPSTVNCETAPPDSGLRTPDPPTQLGFVKRSNGRVETIVAEGEHVRLVRGEPVLLAGVGTRDSRPATRDSGMEPDSQENPLDSRNLPVKRRKLNVESTMTEVNLSRAQRPKATVGEGTEFGLPDTLQPEALGHFDRNPTRYLDLRDDLRPQTETIANQAADELWEATSDESAIQPPEIPDTPGSGPPIPHQIGYIERVVGQAEAIVAVGKEVHFVREGDIFADRFRALSVSPSWVEIEELPLGRRASPEVFLSLGPALPDTPEPRGPSSHSPPGRDANGARGTDLATGPRPPGERVLPKTLRPPPGAALGRFVPAAVQASPRAGPVDAGLGPPAERITLKPVGFAVKGDGETVAFVAVEGEVFLVREGEKFAGRYKVLRVTATAVEITPEALHGAPEVARRSFGSSAGKPTAPTASNDSGLISLDLTTSARIGIPDFVGTTSSGVSFGYGEGSPSGPELSGGGLHSQAWMLDNPGNRH